MLANAVFQKDFEVHDRLALLGLSPEVLQEAGRSGKRARAGNTPFHPKWYAGNVMYSNALATLGELLVDAGFRREDPAGHPLVVHYPKKLAVLVATSDHNTGNGDPSKPPSTRPWKGPRTEEAVEENDLLLFPDMFNGIEQRHPLDGFEFWWLLMHADEANNELRMELSRGIRMSKDRSVDSWSERIMLASQPLDEGGLTIISEPNDQGPLGGEYEVEVTKLG
jgi:hypothetical protein